MTNHPKTCENGGQSRGMAADGGLWLSAVELAPIMFGVGHKGIYMALTSLAMFADESFDKELLCVGGLFSFPEHFPEDEWQHCLDRHDIKYFSASDCEMLIGEFDPREHGHFGKLTPARAFAEMVSCELVRILGESPATSISVALALDDFKQLVGENHKAAEHFGTDAATFTYRELIKATIELLNRDWPQQKLPIAFTFDDHNRWREAEDAYQKVRDEGAQYAERMSYVGHADDKTHPPLQMADLVAYEARYKALAYLGKPSTDRVHFQQLADENTFTYIGLLNRAGLLAKLADK